MVAKVAKEKPKLKVAKRKVEGRQVKSLRKQGILPANIFGKGLKSLAVQIALKDFMPVFESVGETGIVELNVEGEDKVRPILIHNVQLDPLSSKPLHADFHQVDLKEAITADIPVEIIGEAPAVAQKIGILIQPLSEIEVEALPGSLPDKFEVDVSLLKAVDEAVLVGDLKVPTGVKILTSAKEVLVKIEPPAKEEVAPPPAEEVVVEEEPVEGEPAGEKPTEEAKRPEEAKASPKKEAPAVGKPIEGARPVRPEPSRGKP